MLVNCLSNGCTKCCNVYCRYSMLNGVIDSREVKAQKVALSSQSSSTSSIHRRSEDELNIIRLKEAMRQRDEYYATCFAQQQAMLQVSWVISLQLIQQLGIILVLILYITTYIANDSTTRIWHVIVCCSPTTTTSVWLASWSSGISLSSRFSYSFHRYNNLFH
jgi:hypothetical protein